jgi:PAS domain S-box-containing protein
LRLWIVGSSLIAGFLGSVLAHSIISPVRKAILEAQKMIEYVEAEPRPVEAANEVRALSTLFDQAYVSFVELVQAREMLDNINEGIVALDSEGKVAGMNRRAGETLEISLAEAREKSISDLWGSTPTNDVLLRITENALREHEGRVHNRVPFSSPSGKEVLLSVKVSPLKLNRPPRELLGAVLTFSEQLDRSADLPEIVGKSQELAEVLDLVAKAAPTDATVLLTGESGTGKEVIADALHRLSRRKDNPLIKLNCTAIPEGLLESELFGHEKGAFTGADRKKPGKFELADGGTIFLDEIGDMSPSSQAKVLRVLHEKEFTPVGGEKIKKVDVRIIAATNKDLPLEVQQGRFREDLFYRLNVITISIPPLRERKSDIAFLADHFLERMAKKNNAQKKFLARNAMELLLAHIWPGNIRELENALERAFLLSDGSIIQAEDLPITPVARQPLPEDLGHVNSSSRHASTKGASLNETIEALEKELIIQALIKSDGVQVEAARMLGLNRKNLWHKIKKHNIDSNDLKIDNKVTQST